MAKIITPKIDSISPTSGPAGTAIVIKGSGFVDGNNIHGIFFGGVATHDWTGEDKANLVGWVAIDDTTIEAIAPTDEGSDSHAPGAVAVMVRTEGGIGNFGNTPVESNTVGFTYTA